MPPVLHQTLWLTTVLLAALVSGCAEFPDLDAAVSSDALLAPYPAILPIGDLLVPVAAPAPLTAVATLQARAAALRTRAAALRATSL